MTVVGPASSSTETAAASVPSPEQKNADKNNKASHAPTSEGDSTHSGFLGTTLVLRSSLSSSSQSSSSLPNDNACFSARVNPADQADHHIPNHRTVAITVDSVVGSGSFSYVYLAHQVQLNHSQSLYKMLAADSERTLVHQPLASSSAAQIIKRAVKRLFKEGLDQRQLRLQRHEVLIMNEIGPHDNIVPLIGTVEDDKCLYLVMEYCEMGK
ncbi:hypothetical protein BC830DRAFT_1174637 [Chytriomyces sp. MP71]|nr:hypothetical protein BC830DRAFT_1174637 [Chytriomyces sp. MP71]